ncbi:hypothetical protein P10159_3151 [Citrobacter portucalensis]|nr:hypothetical protein P10159_3151 [Citrobacter portucalensis]
MLLPLSEIARLVSHCAAIFCHFRVKDKIYLQYAIVTLSAP